MSAHTVKRARTDGAVAPAAAVDVTDVIVSSDACADSDCTQRLTRLDSLGLIGRICIEKKLPGGTPCWLARKIGGLTSARRFVCPASARSGDDACAGGCDAESCCGSAAPTCARELCAGGCQLCAGPRECQTCSTLGCAVCVGEHSLSAHDIRLLAAVAVGAAIRGDTGRVMAALAIAHAAERAGRCDYCRE
jgi:hypothetical protein